MSSTLFSLPHNMEHVLCTVFHYTALYCFAKWSTFVRYSAQWSWFVRQCLQYGAGLCATAWNEAGLCASMEHVLVECAPNCAARATSSHTLTFNYQRKNTGSVLGELTSTRKLQFCKTPFQFQGLKIREGVQKMPSQDCPRPFRAF